MLEVAVIAPITVGLVQAIKATGYLESRFAPLVSVALATILTLAFYAQQGTLGVESLLFGIIYGLTASGLFDAGRAVLNTAPRETP